MSVTITILKTATTKETSKNSVNMKQIIWTSEAFFDDEARKAYEAETRDRLEDDGYCVSDNEWAEIIQEYLSDERQNLNKEIDGVIVAFADLGFWYGRRQGYKILNCNVNDIFSISEDDNEWFGDGFNIRSRHTHHDGTHHVLYRVAKNREDAERIAEQIYECQMDEQNFRKRTRSLYPYVAHIYGWKSRRFDKWKQNDIIRVNAS